MRVLEMDGKDFALVGAFTPREITRVTNHLEAIGVDYEVEFDDSEIRDMPLATAAYGALGTSATVKLYVDPEKMLKFDAVMETLYPA